MIIKCYNENHPYLVFIDLEFNNRDLIQFAGLLFKRIDDGIYQLMRSMNQYITASVCYHFTEYTHITTNFLNNNGITLTNLQELIKEDFLADIDLKDIEVISHGLKSDRMILIDNGINLTSQADKKPIDGFCTFSNAKKILERDNKLSAADLASEAGYYLHQAHNAYNDVWAEVSIFTYLKKIEYQKSQERKR